MPTPDTPQTFREYYGDEQCQQIRDRLEALFNSNAGGFVIIGNVAEKRVTDAYQDICDMHVIDLVRNNVVSAVKHGLVHQHTAGDDV